MAGPLHGGFGGGSYSDGNYGDNIGDVNVDFNELFSLDFVFESLEKIYSFLTSTWNFMVTPLNVSSVDLFTKIGLEGELIDSLSDALSFLLSKTFIGDLSPMHIAFGAIIYLLVVRHMIKFFLNI